MKTRKKRAIWNRANYICHWCFKKMTESEATVDHVIPRSYGGSSDNSNLVASCKDCNQERGRKMQVVKYKK